MTDIDKLVELTLAEKEMEELVEWELSSMDYPALEDFFIGTMIDFYVANPKAFRDMKAYRDEYLDTEIVVEKE